MARMEKKIVELEPQHRKAEPQANPFDLAIGREARHRHEASLVGEVRRSFQMLADSQKTRESAWRLKRKAA